MCQGLGAGASALWSDVTEPRHKAERWIIMSKMTSISLSTKHVSDEQALALHEGVDKIMRRFKLEPGMLVGSAYADLHVNDVGLLAILAETEDWNVRKITQALRAPFSTVSSALDRLEARRLVGRRRRPGDRRTVYIELTAAGLRLARKLRATQIETCRAMLSRLSPHDRAHFIRLVSAVARDSKGGTLPVEQ